MRPFDGFSRYLSPPEKKREKNYIFLNNNFIFRILFSTRYRYQQQRQRRQQKKTKFSHLPICSGSDGGNECVRIGTATKSDRKKKTKCDGMSEKRKEEEKNK